MMNLLPFLLLSLSLFTTNVQSWQDEAQDDKLFEKYISTAGNYTLSRALDGERGGNILHIKVAVALHKLTFTEPDQATLHLVLIQQWHDTRLKFTSTNGQNAVRLTRKTSKRVWLPDTYFANALNPETQDPEVVKGDKTTVSTSGDLCHYQWRVVKVACTTGFTFYPVDQQRCTLNLRSKEFNEQTIYNVTGIGKGVWSVDGISTPDMKLYGFNRKLSTDKYTYNTVEVVISRRPFFYYLTRFYLPPFLVVLAAYLPLYMAPTIKYKVMTGIGSTLIMVTLMAGFYPELPKIHTLTALDLYLLFCFCSVFLVVVEYSFIGYFDVKKSNKKAGDKETGGDDDDRKPINGSKKVKKVKTNSRLGVFKQKAAKIVHFAVGKLYPIIFVIFHILYGIVLLVVVLKQKYGVELRHPTAKLGDIC